MPTYVYRCTQCEKQFEIEQRIVEDALTHCDTCDAETLKRVIQPVGVAFKGSGFHINDYSSSSSPAPADSSTAEASPSDAPAPTPTPTEVSKPAEPPAAS